MSSFLLEMSSNYANLRAAAGSSMGLLELNLRDGRATCRLFDCVRILEEAVQYDVT